VVMRMPSFPVNLAFIRLNPASSNLAVNSSDGGTPMAQSLWPSRYQPCALHVTWAATQYQRSPNLSGGMDPATQMAITLHGPSPFHERMGKCACRPPRGAGRFHHFLQSCPMRQGPLRDAASLRVLARPAGRPLTHLAFPQSTANTNLFGPSTSNIPRCDLSSRPISDTTVATLLPAPVGEFLGQPFGPRPRGKPESRHRLPAKQRLRRSMPGQCDGWAGVCRHRCCSWLLRPSRYRARKDVAQLIREPTRVIRR
jgi:hypothetical protein